MKRITAVLKTSEVTEVRKAIFAAGGSRIAAATVSHRLGLSDWYCGTPERAKGDYVRLDVTVDDSRSAAVVSSIIATARSGMIEKIAPLPAKAVRIAAPLLAGCAA